MNKLSKETIDRIEQEAEAYAESHGDHLSNINEYSTHNDISGAYNAGATEWAGRAHPVIDAMDELLDLLPSGNALNHYFAKDAVTKAREELAKYRLKELGLQRKQFAALMNSKPPMVTRWLSGEHNFEIITLFEIERVLNLPLFNYETIQLNDHFLDEFI